MYKQFNSRVEPLTWMNPKDVQKYYRKLNLLIYGMPGVGKSYACCQFPRTLFIDTEKGIAEPEYLDLLTKNESSYVYATSVDKIIATLEQKLKGQKHNFLTIVIDSITVLYDAVVDQLDSYLEAGKRMKKLFSCLEGLNMNMVLTAHSKYIPSPFNSADQIMTPDGWKRLSYRVGVELALRKEKDSNTRIAAITKSRIGSKFKIDEEFEFSYKEIARRYDKDIIEGNSFTPAIANEVELDTFVKKTTNKFVDATRLKSPTYGLNNQESEMISELKKILATEYRTSGTITNKQIVELLPDPDTVGNGKIITDKQLLKLKNMIQNWRSADKEALINKCGTNDLSKISLKFASYIIGAIIHKNDLIKGTV